MCDIIKIELTNIYNIHTIRYHSYSRHHIEKMKYYRNPKEYSGSLIIKAEADDITMVHILADYDDTVVMWKKNGTYLLDDNKIKIKWLTSCTISCNVFGSHTNEHAVPEIEEIVSYEKTDEYVAIDGIKYYPRAKQDDDDSDEDE